MDNLGSHECDRFREYLRQLVMPLRSRPTSTRANAGRPARVSATEHGVAPPDRPAYGDTAPRPPWTCETHWYGRPPRSTDAECGQHCVLTTQPTARRLPGHRGNDLKLRTDASECFSPTGLTILTRA
ncbi:hypothetical protein EVAR_60861_1 [Eumeta japonica]|uniref:Uncharacterized protein n=1 Tax=Eumeta variegata TaxID=151549 RepID=A0A4C1YA01_EUMVA|nr:hypothetical protein EVAR_60861_1 [Eumeta japonica]